jgi:hypothetical protein
MKITLKPCKPRNPLIAAALFRRAGSHQPRQATLRQRSGRALRRELEQLTRPKPIP